MGRNSDPWTRLLTHALLRGSRIFPGLEMPDKPPDYTHYGFADVWRGEYHGEPVCVKVARGYFLSELMELKQVRRPFYSIGRVLSPLHTRHTIVWSKGAGSIFIRMCSLSFRFRRNCFRFAS